MQMLAELGAICPGCGKLCPWDIKVNPCCGTSPRRFLSLVLVSDGEQRDVIALTEGTVPLGASRSGMAMASSLSPLIAALAVTVPAGVLALTVLVLLV